MMMMMIMSRKMSSISREIHDILIHPFTPLFVRPTSEVRVSGSCRHLEAVLLTKNTAMQWMNLHTTICTAGQVYSPLDQVSNISNRIS